MFREIVHIGPIHIYSYGLMQFLAFAVAIFVGIKRGKKYNIDKNTIFDLAFWVLIGGITGARIWYVIEHFKDYQDNLISIFQIWNGGLVIYGGLIFGFIFALIFIKKNKLNFWEIADTVSPSIFLGLFIGRIGCFLNGCCYGMESDTLGIIFHDYSNCQLYPDAPIGIAVIPTQIYSSISALFFFVYLMLLSRRVIRTGEVFSWLLIFYGVHRFSVDFLRHYDGKALILKYLTLSQTMSVFLIITGIIILIFKNEYGKSR